MREKVDVQLDRCWVTWSQVGFGVTQFLCFSPACPSPAGVVWAMVNGKLRRKFTRVEVSNSYIVDWARRQGVRSYINQEIFEKYGADVICTADGSDEGGLAFLKHWRYRHDKAAGSWVLTKRTWRRRRKELYATGEDN